MAKKKKQSEHARQKVLMAQHRNEFMRRLKHICDLINPEVSVYDLLTEIDRLSIYQFRSAPAKAVVAPGSKVPHDMLDNIESTFKKTMASVEIELTKGTGVYISPSDFFNIVFPLEIFLQDEKFQIPGREYFEEFLKDRQRVERYVDKVLLLKKVMEMYCSDISKCLCCIYCDFKILHPDEHDYRRQVTLEVSTVEPEKQQVIIDGVSRTAYRLAWVIEGEPYLISIPVAKIDANSRFPDLRIQVYVQQHALDRLMERAGITWRGMIHMEMVLSILKADIIRNSHGDLLITHTMSGKKVGYFRAVSVDGIIFIRTFLFLTNNGTPEGKKLEQLTGLQKLDKEYLNIDRLETLAHSDILENEEVCSLFKKAGCQPLLELCEIVKNDSIMKEYLPEKQIEIASRMSEYLKSEKDAGIRIVPE